MSDGTLDNLISIRTIEAGMESMHQLLIHCSVLPKTFFACEKPKFFIVRLFMSKQKIDLVFLVNGFIED